MYMSLILYVYAYKVLYGTDWVLVIYSVILRCDILTLAYFPTSGFEGLA